MGRMRKPRITRTDSRSRSTDPGRIEAALEHAGKLLVIEGAPENRHGLAGRLRKKGHEVVSASTGHDALALSARVSFDAAVVSTAQTDRSAFDVLRMLVSETDIPEIVIAGAGDICFSYVRHGGQRAPGVAGADAETAP